MRSFLQSSVVSIFFSPLTFKLGDGVLPMAGGQDGHAGGAEPAAGEGAPAGEKGGQEPLAEGSTDETVDNKVDAGVGDDGTAAGLAKDSHPKPGE